MHPFKNLKMRMEWLRQDLKKSALNAHTNQYQQKKYEDLLKSFDEYITHLDFIQKATPDTIPLTHLDLLEVIKKQALIIKAARIDYPTINQPLPLIYDYYLASIGDMKNLGAPHHRITVEIEVI
jgi:hypothetical protein